MHPSIQKPLRPLSGYPPYLSWLQTVHYACRYLWDYLIFLDMWRTGQQHSTDPDRSTWESNPRPSCCSLTVVPSVCTTVIILGTSSFYHIKTAALTHTTFYSSNTRDDAIILLFCWSLISHSCSNTFQHGHRFIFPNLN